MFSFKVVYYTFFYLYYTRDLKFFINNFYIFKLSYFKKYIYIIIYYKYSLYTL